MIVRDDKVLLVKRGNTPWRGYWDVPGGFCEAHETPEETVLREIGEELRISVRIMQYHGSWIGNYRGPDSDGDDRTLLCIYFLVEPTDSEIKLEPNESEVIEARWFSKGEMPNKIGFPENNEPALARWETADRF